MKRLNQVNRISNKELLRQLNETYANQIIKHRQKKLELTDLLEEYEKQLKGSILYRTVSSVEIQHRIKDIKKEMMLRDLEVDSLETSIRQFHLMVK